MRRPQFGAQYRSASHLFSRAGISGGVARRQPRAFRRHRNQQRSAVRLLQSNDGARVLSPSLPLSPESNGDREKRTQAHKILRIVAFSKVAAALVQALLPAIFNLKSTKRCKAPRCHALRDSIVRSRRSKELLMKRFSSRNVAAGLALSVAPFLNTNRARRSANRARLLNGASSVTLAAVSTIVVLVSAPGNARAQTTVNPVQTTTFSLTPAQNPIIFGAGTNVDTEATAGADAVDGNVTTTWTVTNRGRLAGNQNGILFASGGSVINNNIISGRNGVGVSINGIGSVINTGTIMGTIGIDILGAGGAVTNSGTITGNSGTAVIFRGTGINTLTLQTGSVLNGDAVGSTAAGATNNLVLEGSGTANNKFLNFNTLDVQATGTWLWNNASGTIGQTTVESGIFAVDSQLFSPVTVKSGAVLAGRGTINGAVSVAGTIAPGAAVPFSTLS